MKTILAPIDFSETSLNAAHYAAKLAKIEGAKLLLCHIYNLPITATDAPVILVDHKAIEDGVKAGLQKRVDEFKKEYGIEVLGIHSLNFPVDGINAAIKDKKADLVVMGISGSGLIMQWLVGSTATGLLKTAKCPVLIIPSECKFKSIKEIVIARDRDEIETTSLPILKEIVQQFKSHVHVLNVVKFHQLDPILVDTAREKAINHLEKFSPEIHFIEREDTVEAIDEFLIENKMDLLVMIPRSHNLLEKILIGSTTKKMAFHTHIPLLSLSSH